VPEADKGQPTAGRPRPRARPTIAGRRRRARRTSAPRRPGEPGPAGHQAGPGPRGVRLDGCSAGGAGHGRPGPRLHGLTARLPQTRQARMTIRASTSREHRSAGCTLSVDLGSSAARRPPSSSPARLRARLVRRGYLRRSQTAGPAGQHDRCRRPSSRGQSGAGLPPCALRYSAAVHDVQHSNQAP